MPFNDLTEEEKSIVRECLVASLEGPFFPDWEFHTIFGITREELKKVISAWPNIDLKNKAVDLAIHNSLNNLIGYPHGKENEWSKYISKSLNDIKAIQNKLIGKERANNNEGKNYFENLK